MVSTIGLWESNRLTFFKTLFARMNNVKAGKFVDDETGESLNDVEKVLHELGIELRGQNDLFRSSADVLDEVAARWNDFDNVQQHAIATAMAGTRQQEKLITLLSNYDSALKYTETSLNSAGTAVEKFGAYTESIEGKTNSLKASFEQFSMTVLDSDLVADVMGFFETIMNGVTGIASFIENLGGLKTVLLAVAAALAITNGGLIAYNLTLKVTAGLKAIILFFTKLGNGIMGIVRIIPNAITAWQAYAAGTVSASTAMQASIPVIGLVIAAITALIGVMSLANNARDEAVQEAKSAAEAAATLSNEIAELTHNYLSLSDAVKTDASAKESLLQTQEELLDKLKLEKYEINELIDKYGSYTEAIKNASLEQLKEDERKIRGGFTVSEDELVDEAEHGVFSLGFLQGHISSGDASILDEYKVLFGGDIQSTKNERDAYAAWEALEDAGYHFVNPRARGTDSDGNNFLESFDLITPDEYNDFETPEDVVRAYKDLGKAIDIVVEEAGHDNFVYDALNKQSSAMSKYVENYLSQKNALNETLAHQYTTSTLLGREIPKTKEEFDEYRQSVIDAAVSSGKFVGTNEDIVNVIDSVLSKQAAYSSFYEIAENNSNRVVVSLKNANDMLEEIQEGYNGLREALEGVTSEGYLTAEALSSLYELSKDDALAGLDLSKIITQDANGYKLATDALQQYVDALINAYTIKNVVFASEEDRDNAIANLETLRSVLATLAQSEIEEHKKAFDEQLDNYKELIDIRKELLETYEKELSYQKELEKKQRNVASLQTRLAVAKLDDSASGQARVRELEAELQEAQEELDDFTLEHAIEVLTDRLDAQYSEYEYFIKGKLDEITTLIAGISKPIADKIDEAIASVILYNEYGKKPPEPSPETGETSKNSTSSSSNPLPNLTNRVGQSNLFPPSPYSTVYEYRNAVIKMADELTANYKGTEWIKQTPHYKSIMSPVSIESAIASWDAMRRIYYDITGAFPNYHTGGFVGGTTRLKSNEEFAKLLKGEMVVTPEQMKRFMKDTLPQVANFGRSGINEFNAPLIEINCENVSSESMPELKRIVDAAVSEVKKTLESGLSRTGYKRQVVKNLI